MCLRSPPRPPLTPLVAGCRGIKVHNSAGDSNHSYAASLTYKALCASVKASFELGDDAGLRFSYVDEDGDVCSVTTEQELRHAVASFVPLPLPVAVPLAHTADEEEDSAAASTATSAATLVPAAAKASRSLKLECVVVPGAGGDKRKKEKKEKKTPAVPPPQPREEATGGTGPLLLDPSLIEELDD